jgi:signal transduction histidine kinase
LPDFQIETNFTQNLANGEIWVLEDIVELDPQSQATQYIRSQGLLTILSAPLCIGEKLLGSLNFAYDQPTEISHEHKEIARQVASSLVLAIQNARLRDTITQHSHDLKQLSDRLITAQETERKRISYALHDEIGQILTAIVFDLVAIEQDVKELGSPPVKNKLADAKMLVEQLMVQVRSMSLELRPAMLQELGLASTLRWYVNTYADRRDMDIYFESLELSGRFPEEVEITLYRIFQEALTNVSRHAHASRVTLCLEKNGTLISASIEDDGVGFNVQETMLKGSPAPGLGLLSMRERVTSLNGRFELQSSQGEGTRLWVEIPVGEKV